MSPDRFRRKRLCGFNGLHFTPPEWLHMTTLVVGPAARYSAGQLRQMIQTAGQLLTDIPPITITLGRILYHPEAIVLSVTPAAALTTRCAVSFGSSSPEVFVRLVGNCRLPGSRAVGYQ